MPVRDGVVAGDQAGLRFQNANGSDLDIFPGFLLMRAKGDRDYALIDLRELRLDFSSVQFVESDAVPPDSRVVGHAWARSNKDGSPDRRFKDNFHIPIALYGELRFSTHSGVAEAYQASDHDAARGFAEAFWNLQRSLREQAAVPAGQSPAHEVTLLDVESEEKKNQLPSLPTVRGAHELTALFGLLLCAGIYVSFGRLDEGTPEDIVSEERSAPRQTSPEPPGDARTMPTLQAATPKPQPSRPLSISPLDQPDHVQRRVSVAQTSNIRSGPDRAAAVVRVASAGITLRVFETNGVWVKVGDDQAWGWIHSSLLRSSP
jgi:hypothetical protein